MKKENIVKICICLKFFFISGILLMLSCCEYQNSAVNNIPLNYVVFELPVQGNDELTDSESVKNFKNEDVSNIQFANRSDGTIYMDNGYYHIRDDNGDKSGRILNWVLNSNYTNYSSCGFSVYIKVNKNMNYTGMQLFDKSASGKLNYNHYQFDVYSDGSFYVKQNISGKNKNVLQLKAGESHIDVNKFNRITVRTVDSGAVQIFVNGYLVKTIEKADLKFSLTESDKTAVEYNVKNDASVLFPAEAWIKIESLQNRK